MRVVVPGYIGGRCVKWLARIWISDKENDSYYHIWDNRVLPPFVTEKDGKFAQIMFRHPDTACNEQNLNSMIAKPAQDEKLDPEEVLKSPTYRIEGIAYDGAGHMVQRVEVSLNEGKSWLYCIRKVFILLQLRKALKSADIHHSIRNGLCAMGINSGRGAIGMSTLIRSISCEPRALSSGLSMSSRTLNRPIPCGTSWV